jgi:transposase
VAAIDNGSGFRKGRDFAAWIGVVPRQHSTGGKTTLYGISKRGNRYLRRLLIHAAAAGDHQVLPGSAEEEEGRANSQTAGRKTWCR